MVNTAGFDLRGKRLLGFGCLSGAERPRLSGTYRTYHFEVKAIFRNIVASAAIVCAFSSISTAMAIEHPTAADWRAWRWARAQFAMEQDELDGQRRSQVAARRAIRKTAVARRPGRRPPAADAGRDRDRRQRQFLPDRPDSRERARPDRRPPPRPAARVDRKAEARRAKEAAREEARLFKEEERREAAEERRARADAARSAKEERSARAEELRQEHAAEKRERAEEKRRRKEEAAQARADAKRRKIEAAQEREAEERRAVAEAERVEREDAERRAALEREVLKEATDDSGQVVDDDLEDELAAELDGLD